MAEKRKLQRLQLTGLSTADLRFELGQHRAEIFLQHLAIEQQYRDIGHRQQLLKLHRCRERAQAHRDGTGKTAAEHSGEILGPVRSEERRVGKECGSSWRTG